MRTILHIILIAFISHNLIADPPGGIWNVVDSPAHVGELLGEEVNHAWAYMDDVDGTWVYDFSPRSVNQGLDGPAIFFVANGDRTSEAAKRYQYLKVTSRNVPRQQFPLSVGTCTKVRYRPFTNNCYTNMMLASNGQFNGKGLGPKLQSMNENPVFNRVLNAADDTAIYVADQFFDGDPAKAVIAYRDTVTSKPFNAGSGMISGITGGYLGQKAADYYGFDGRTSNNVGAVCGELGTIAVSGCTVFGCGIAGAVITLGDAAYQNNRDGVREYNEMYDGASSALGKIDGIYPRY